MVLVQANENKERWTAPNLQTNPLKSLTDQANSYSAGSRTLVLTVCCCIRQLEWVLGYFLPPKNQCIRLISWVICSSVLLFWAQLFLKLNKMMAFTLLESKTSSVKAHQLFSALLAPLVLTGVALPLLVVSSCRSPALSCPDVCHQSLRRCSNKGSTFLSAISTRWEPQQWDISAAASSAHSLQWRVTWGVNRWGWNPGYGVDCIKPRL